MLRPIVIVKAGRTLPAIAARRGDFETWITRGMGVSEADVRVVDVFGGERLPPPSDARAAVVTGSTAMVSHHEPWSVRTAHWLGDAIRGGLPTLGICYGHQLVAEALGGRAGPNPRGREFGTVHVRLTDEGTRDPLLGPLGDAFPAHAAHRESALVLPEGARVLAENDLDPYQAFTWGDACWCVQFHPEFDADIVRGYVAGYRAALADEGWDVDALLADRTESPAGGVLRRFAERVV